MEPLGERVLVKPFEEQKVRAGLWQGLLRPRCSPLVGVLHCRLYRAAQGNQPGQAVRLFPCRVACWAFLRVPLPVLPPPLHVLSAKFVVPVRAPLARSADATGCQCGLAHACQQWVAEKQRGPHRAAHAELGCYLSGGRGW